jgi:hypothetical protein
MGFVTTNGKAGGDFRLYSFYKDQLNIYQHHVSNPGHEDMNYLFIFSQKENKEEEEKKKLKPNRL